MNGAIVKAHKIGPQRPPSWDVQVHEKAREELLDLGDEDYERVDAHLAQLEDDPMRPRPGMDVRKLKDVSDGGLYRLRVGKHRAIFVVMPTRRKVRILVVEDREIGYARMIQRAMARLTE